MSDPYEMQRRAAVHYAKAARKIITGPRNDWAIDPYDWDHGAGIALTPIENNLWHDIRAADLVFYPQWPVAGHFVDFGNPVAKVAIECDGKAFHDPERDAPRQRKIEALGWHVYRFTGRECNEQTYIETYDRMTECTAVRASSTFKRLQEIGRKHDVCRDGRAYIPGPRSIDEIFRDLLAEFFGKEDAA